MGVLEFLPAPRRVMRLLASEPEEFAEEFGVRLHEVAQGVAEHSLAFMRTFSLETPAEWFGHFAIVGETQQMAGICTLKGPPSGGEVEMAYFTFPGFEGRGIGTALAQFVLDRARKLPGVKVVMAHTPPDPSAATRILEKIGMEWMGEEHDEDGARLWRWEFQVD